MGKKPTFDAFCYSLSSCSVAVVAFACYQSSSHIPSCFMVLAKNPENTLAFGVEGAKGHES